MRIEPEKLESYLLLGDKRSPQEVLEAGNFTLIGLQARRFVTSFENGREGRIGWSYGQDGDATIRIFSLPYAPSADMLERELQSRGLTLPREEDALRYGALLAKQRNGMGPKGLEPVLFYHAMNLWRQKRIASAFEIDALRGTFPRIRCVPVPDLWMHDPDARIIGDRRFAGRVKK